MEDVIPGSEEVIEEVPAEGADGAVPGEEGAAPEGGEGTPQGADGAEGVAPGTEVPPYVLDLQERLKKFEDAQAAKAGEQPTAPAPAVGPTPEFFEGMKKDFGFYKATDENGKEITGINPDAFAKGMLQFGRDMIRMAKEHAEGLVHGSTSEIRTDSIISDLATKTPDIRRYTPQIKEYLKKRYAAKDHSNPDFIMDAYYWSKGRGGQAPAGTPGRSNVRVLNTPAPANRRPGAPLKPLGGIAKNMIGKEFKDEKEYRAWANADLSRL